MKLIVIDSSFLIATIKEEDIFHKKSNIVMDAILQRKNEARIIIPSTVFFETIFCLNKNNLDKNIIKEKLWHFLFSDQIFNVNLLETSAFRLFKHYPRENLQGFKTSDYLIVSTALAFNGLLLTYDKGLKRNAGKVYEHIYYCAPNQEFGDESEKFLDELIE